MPQEECLQRHKGSYVRGHVKGSVQLSMRLRGLLLLDCMQRQGSRCPIQQSMQTAKGPSTLSGASGETHTTADSIGALGATEQPSNGQDWQTASPFRTPPCQSSTTTPKAMAHGHTTGGGDGKVSIVGEAPHQDVVHLCWCSSPRHQGCP